MEKRFRVDGMMCDHCRAHVEKALNSVAGVSASVTLSPPVAAAVFAGDTVPVETLQRAVDALAGDYRPPELCSGGSYAETTPAVLPCRGRAAADPSFRGT